MLDLMRLFCQVVEEQSFTVVARKLGISQPAVSNQMRALEEKLAVKLIYRKGKSFALTPEGEVLPACLAFERRMGRVNARNRWFRKGHERESTYWRFTYSW